MVAKKLIAFVAFVMLITLLEQIKSGVHAGRMTKPKKAGRVKVIHTGPRVRKLKKKVEELEKQLASMEPCEPCESAKTEGFLFDSNATTDYLKVEVEGLNKPLVVLTSCTWVKFKDSSPRWEFFWCTLGQHLCLGRASDNLLVRRRGVGFRELNIVIRFNEWSNYCVTTGLDRWKVYVDGTLRESLPAAGIVLKEGNEGKMVYGQFYKDSYYSSENTFNPESCFVGEIAGINVWDRVMSEAEISEMSKSCTSGKGNIVSMADLKVIGGVKKIPASC